MRSILSMLMIVALAAFAVPAMAQQETNTGQDKPTEGAYAGQQGMTNDSAAVAPTQTPEPSQVTPPTTQTAEPATPSDETVTERAATTTEREEGAAMPTTASSLPGIAMFGLLLIAAGVGLRYVRGRS